MFLDVCFQTPNRAFVGSFSWAWAFILMEVIWCGVCNFIWFGCESIAFFGAIFCKYVCLFIAFNVYVGFDFVDSSRLCAVF